MRLFLIRHGESVDNVANLYAGSRDSPLTSHGVLQAKRLGDHLASRDLPIRHVFSSDLQRASHTAQAIVDALLAKARGNAKPSTSTSNGDGDGENDGDVASEEAGTSAPAEQAQQSQLQVIRVRDLRERDFRSGEGVKFGQKSAAGSPTNPHPDAETHEEMRVRAVRFIDEHLESALAESAEAKASVVVVAHGLILGALLRALLARFGPSELARLGEGRSEYLASWSNTGYLEAVVRTEPVKAAGAGRVSSGEEADSRRIESIGAVRTRSEIQLIVTATNVIVHLQGLKKTRGGIGSAQFDSKQKTMDSFFGPAAKKPRTK